MWSRSMGGFRDLPVEVALFLYLKAIKSYGAHTTIDELMIVVNFIIAVASSRGLIRLRLLNFTLKAYNTYY